ncbi:MAG: DUF1015 family protein [Acidimicrobiales bacterium]
MTVPFVQPVVTRLVKPDWAARVVSPAYDSVRPEGRRELMDRDPYVFLHVTRSPGDVGDGLSPERVTDQNAQALEWLLAEGVFGELREAGMYLYRLSTEDHSQIGIVADVHLAGVEDGRIGPHERIMPQRATHLADHIARVGVNSSPVAFGYKDDPVIDSVVAEVVGTEPLLSFEREDHLAQTIWAVPPEHVELLAERLARRRLYIIDGHHRVSAGVEYWRRSGFKDSAGYVLGTMFPTSQLRVSPFHRRVIDLASHDPRSLCDAIAECDFSVRPLAHLEDPTPSEPGVICMYVGGVWHEVKAFRRHPAEFDATVLQERILGPILGVDEGSKAGRLEYLPGTVGLDHLVSITDQEGGAAFALHPVLLSQLMAVVDRGQTLPPKSTYFAPKVRSGLFLAPRR